MDEFKYNEEFIGKEKFRCICDRDGLTMKPECKIHGKYCLETPTELKASRNVVALINKLDSLGYELPEILLASVREYDEVVK